MEWLHRLRRLAPSRDVLPVFLRSLGLEIINTRWRRTQNDEPAKPVLQKSLWHALARCSVHIFPVGISALILTVNFTGQFLGAGFTEGGGAYDSIALGFMQLSAKIQEMLCLASLSAITLQLLRHLLISGDGVPLGLLGSGVGFTQLSLLWSPELLSSIKWGVAKWTQFHLFMMLIACCLLAASIGPATALLIQPRPLRVLAGGAMYFVNGTADEFWPTMVDETSEPEECFFANASRYPVCPSGGYNAFRTMTVARYNRLGNHRYEPQFRAKWDILDSFNFNFLVQDELRLVPSMLSIGSLYGLTPATYAIQPFLSSIIVQQSLNEVWTNAALRAGNAFIGSTAGFKYFSSMSSSFNASFPAAVSKCTPAQNVSGAADTAQFFTWQSTRDYWSSDMTTINISDLDQNMSTHLRTQWVTLPSDSINTPTVGLLFELPWSAGTDSRVLLACSVAAWWVDGTLISDSTSSYYAWYAAEFDRAFFDFRFRDTPSDAPRPVEDTRRQIVLTRPWLELVTPTAPEFPRTDDEWAPNTLEYILYLAGYEGILPDYKAQPQLGVINDECGIVMMNTLQTDTELWNDYSCNKGDKGILLETMLARIVADGLSRRLSFRSLTRAPFLQAWTRPSLSLYPDHERRILTYVEDQNAVDMSVMDPGSVTHKMVVRVDGVAYQVGSSSDYLAVTVILVYMVLATLHIFWVLSFRVTSSSWDTVTELLLLAMHSPPAEELQGSSAGARRWNTFRTPVKVKARPSNNITAPSESSGDMSLALIVQHNTPRLRRRLRKKKKIEATPLRDQVLSARNSTDSHIADSSSEAESLLEEEADTTSANSQTSTDLAELTTTTIADSAPLQATMSPEAPPKSEPGTVEQGLTGYSLLEYRTVEINKKYL